MEEHGGRLQGYEEFLNSYAETRFQDGYKFLVYIDLKEGQMIFYYLEKSGREWVRRTTLDHLYWDGWSTDIIHTEQTYKQKIAEKTKKETTK